jgi:hypothetical protein
LYAVIWRRLMVTQVEAYVAGIADMSANDRQVLRDRWKTIVPDEDNSDDDVDDIWNALVRKRPSRSRPTAAALKPKVEIREPQVNAAGQLVGISLRLGAQFGTVVKAAVEELNQHFKDSLDDKCQTGAKEVRNNVLSFGYEQLITFYLRHPLLLLIFITNLLKSYVGKHTAQLCGGVANFTGISM